ncbi:hypothetical protein KSP39_PZI001877 [Platanthera zijinensis]|uniref:Uncharacterized protein n=1 Tax=Platanthera zijinensis TaxID=2320716 RepID=A0AAP0C0H1_9ASPA
MAVEESASAAPDKRLQPPNCGGNQMKLYGAPLFPAKTPAMSQQQSNLMSPTSSLVMQPEIQRSEPLSPLEKIDLQFVMAMKQSTSAAPAKSLKPPNSSGHQISPPNPQIPNLSSPIVSPSSTSMDAQGAIRKQQLLGSGTGMLGRHSMLSSSQPAAHANTQQQISQLQQQQSQLETVQQRQAAQLLQQQQHHQLQQLQQHHKQQQSPQFLGFTVSKSLTGSQPSTLAFGKNMTREITSSNKDSGQLLGQRKIQQDLVSQNVTAMDLPQISAPQLGHSQIQLTPSGAPIFPPKTLAMSQQQSNLMSPTSNFVMQPALLRSGPMSPLEQIDLQFIKAMEQSTSAAPAKSLKPPNCSGDQMTPSRIRVFPPKMSFGDQHQFDIAMDAQGASRKQQQLSFAVQQQQQLGSGTGMMAQAGQLSMLSSSQPAAHANTQRQISQLIQQQAQLETVQQRQAAQLLQQQQQLHQLQQLQQHHKQQQSPQFSGFTVSNSLTGSQPSTPAFGKNMTPEITSSNKDSCQLLGQRKIQDLVSQVRKALEFQRMESDAAANRLEAILQLMDPLIKSEQLSPPPAAGFHVLQKISQLWQLLSAAFSVCFPAQLLSTQNH